MNGQKLFRVLIHMTIIVAKISFAFIFYRFQGVDMIVYTANYIIGVYIIRYIGVHIT